MHLRSYLLHVVEVSSVLVFPFLGTILYYQIRALETRKKTNAQHSGPIKKRLLFKGQYKKDQIRLLEEQILFLTSEDNYVALHYVEQGEHKTHLIRATMGSLLDQVNSELLVRCHRSYVVNISRIKKMRKSASRDVLFLNDYDKMFPVSRGYRDELLQKLEGLQ